LAWLACGSGSGAGHLAPASERSVALLPVGGGSEAVAAWAEVADDRAVGGEEALGMAGALEAAHAPLALPGWLVRMLRPVVQPPVAPMLDARQDRAPRRAVARQLVGDDDARDVMQALEQRAEGLLRRCLIPAALDQDIEDGAVLVDGAPQVVRHPVDADEYLVKVPLVARSRAAPALAVRVHLAELPAPLAHCLIRDDDAARGEQFLHIAIAEREAEVQPDRVADDLRREALAGVVGCPQLFHAPSIAQAARSAAAVPS